jgi:uncharacterized metal-binding protein
MSSGKAHDRSILVSLLPVSIASFHYLPNLLHFQMAPFLSIAGFAIGGIWLSPDIDLKQSYPSQRLGILSFLWTPYRQLSGHRGFSHIPIIGTLSRMAYAAIPIIPWIYINKSNSLQILWQYKEIIASLFVGLEASCLVHLIMDYTPGLNKN